MIPVVKNSGDISAVNSSAYTFQRYPVFRIEPPGATAQAGIVQGVFYVSVTYKFTDRIGALP